ncbi:hypothetical protein TRIUR3_21660 [Triticum urartu]|uniref:Uncharacterized protein n=1 Tax=Triticum urartu TaxID=4572 RepID=M8A061_TRIUA|nr:hypothetical protein TRIUR3_21660 [Triticum urartu]
MGLLGHGALQQMAGPEQRRSRRVDDAGAWSTRGWIERVIGVHPPWLEQDQDMAGKQGRTGTAGSGGDGRRRHTRERDVGGRRRRRRAGKEEQGGGGLLVLAGGETSRWDAGTKRRSLQRGAAAGGVRCDEVEVRSRQAREAHGAGAGGSALLSIQIEDRCREGAALWIGCILDGGEEAGWAAPKTRGSGASRELGGSQGGV